MVSARAEPSWTRRKPRGEMGKLPTRLHAHASWLIVVAFYLRVVY